MFFCENSHHLFVTIPCGYEMSTKYCQVQVLILQASYDTAMKLSVGVLMYLVKEANFQWPSVLINLSLKPSQKSQVCFADTNAA